MKKTLLNLLLLLITATTFAQAVTTQEEYDYLTKGYPEALEKGLDIKDGYKFEKAFDIQLDEFSFNFDAFINKETNTKKAYLVKIVKKKKKQDKIVYLCMPLGKTRIIDQYVKERYGMGTTMNLYYRSAESLFLSKLVSDLQHEISLHDKK